MVELTVPSSGFLRGMRWRGGRDDYRLEVRRGTERVAHRAIARWGSASAWIISGR